MKEIHTKVAGVTYKDPRSGIDRQWLIQKYIHPGTKLRPQLEPDNPHDPNAIKLWLEVSKKLLFKLLSGRNLWFHIGYIQSDLAQNLAPILRDGQPVTITILEITGGTKCKPTRGLNIVIRITETSDIA